MTRLSVWAIRLSLAHFAVGIVLGATMLAAKAGYGELTMLGHRSTHVHLMLFGWLIQFVMGVAYWILPTFSEGPKRGWRGPAVVGVVGINVGVVVGMFEPWSMTAAIVGWGVELAAVIAFGIHLWPRARVVTGG